jgi:hypothetical protein
MFSSIPEEQRSEVIRRCYWPLLRATERTGMPIGVELTGYTLSVIEALDPTWITGFKELHTKGLVELIGSGYAQIIGPLVPAAVNAANLRLGNQTYERILGWLPTLALVNEQCFSASLVDHFREAGYAGFLMEWENVHHAHPDWSPALRYQPHWVCGVAGEALPVLWNYTIAFQKMQRVVHQVDGFDGYMQWLGQQFDQKVTALSLYCNDVEVFDFRPGRFATEPPTAGASEWETVERIFATLREDGRIDCLLPSAALAVCLPPRDGPVLSLTNAASPTVTKKQEKYNILRWAVTGRNDIAVNSRCLRLAETLEASSQATEEDWRELCYLWSSDFRTHITEPRWAAFLDRMAAFERKWFMSAPPALIFSTKDGTALRVCADGMVRLDGPGYGVRLNARRGLAIHSFWLGDDPSDWLVGTTPFGYHDDISLGADFYSGHMVFQQPGKPQVTDLSDAAPRYIDDPAQPWIAVQGQVKTTLGIVNKELRLHRNHPSLDVLFRLDWPPPPLGVLRLGHLTANSQAFNASKLWFATHNGGLWPEVFQLARRDFDHGKPVSHMVSANMALGMTENTLSFGDDRRVVTVAAWRQAAAVVPMAAWRHLGNDYFFRIYFSAAEMDDTVVPSEESRTATWPLAVAFSITLSRRN